MQNPMAQSLRLMTPRHPPPVQLVAVPVGVAVRAGVAAAKKAAAADAVDAAEAAEEEAARASRRLRRAR